MTMVKVGSTVFGLYATYSHTYKRRRVYLHEGKVTKIERDQITVEWKAASFRPEVDQPIWTEKVVEIEQIFTSRRSAQTRMNELNSAKRGRLVLNAFVS